MRANEIIAMRELLDAISIMVNRKADIQSILAIQNMANDPAKYKKNILMRSWMQMPEQFRFKNALSALS